MIYSSPPFSDDVLIEDRKEASSSPCWSPVPRSAIVLGKVSAHTLATIQGMLFSCSLLRRVHLYPLQVVLVRVVSWSVCLTAWLASRAMDSTQASCIINLFLIPLWLLSGALFPSPPSGWIRPYVYEPLTYGVEALRPALSGMDSPFPCLADGDASSVFAGNVRTRIPDATAAPRGPPRKANYDREQYAYFPA